MSDDLRRILRQRLELERMMGADVFPRGGTLRLVPASPGTRSGQARDVGRGAGDAISPEPRPPSLVPPTESPVPRPPPLVSSTGSRAPAIDPASVLSDEARSKYVALRAEALACVKCGLCKSRTQVVFGVGTPKAALMFVGEAPGADEDRLGEPFVGRAGQLLTRALGELGVRREDVYIANILKCRPPDNRKPEPDEISQCFPYLRRQIEIIRPRILCALGGVAAQALLGRPEPITKIRGTFYDFPWVPGLRVMPTFHPAYLLRSPWEMPKLKEDIRRILKELKSQI